jgi:hypothetical protein
MLRKFSLCGSVGPDFRLGLGRLSPRLARRLVSPRRVGSAFLRRRTRLFRLWRLLCPHPGPDPLGTPLAARQPLLLRVSEGCLRKPRPSLGFRLKS